MIILDRQQTDEADNVAILRRAYAIKNGREQKRGLQEMSALELLYLDTLGTRAELAGHLLFRVPWRPYVENEVVRSGDLAGFVEIKGVARPRDRLFIKNDKANPEHAYLLFDGTFHPAWHAIGWIWGKDAMRVEYQQTFLQLFGEQDDWSYVIPRMMPPMRPVRELFDLVKARGNGQEVGEAG